MADAGPTSSTRGRRRWVIGAAIAAAAVIAAVVVWFLTAGQPPRADAAPTATTATPAPSVTPSATPTPTATAPQTAWPSTVLTDDIDSVPSASWTVGGGLPLTSTGSEGEALLTLAGENELTVALLDTATGHQVWRSVIADRPMHGVLWAASPSDDHIVVLEKDLSGASYRLVSLDRRTGEVVSHSEARDHILGIRSSASQWTGATASFDGNIVVYTDDGQISALAPTDLRSAIWSIDASNIARAETWTGIEEKVVAAGEVILVGSAVHSLADGSSLDWSADAGGAWYTADGVLVHLKDLDIAAEARAVDPLTGESLWTLESERFVAAGTDLLSLRAGHAYRVEPRSGALEELELSGAVPAGTSRIAQSSHDVVLLAPDGPGWPTAYLDVSGDRVRITSLADFTYAGSPLDRPSVMLSSPGLVYVHSAATGMLYGVPRGETEAVWEFAATFSDMDWSTTTAVGGTLFDREEASGVTALK